MQNTAARDPYQGAQKGNTRLWKEEVDHLQGVNLFIPCQCTACLGPMDMGPKQQYARIKESDCLQDLGARHYKHSASDTQH